MSLDREDLRGRCSRRYHRAVLAICRRRGITMAEYIEALVVADVDRIAHDVIGIGDELKGLGFAATGCDSPSDQPVTD